jgi:hypothetical protein
LEELTKEGKENYSLFFRMPGIRNDNMKVVDATLHTIAIIKRGISVEPIL